MKNLKLQKIWVCWKHDLEKGKIPINPYTGNNAMSNNPNTWSYYNEAYRRSKQYSGMGFMFSNGYCGIDLDGLDNHTKVNCLHTEILKIFEGTYIELSPSGTGYHIIFKCNIDCIPTEIVDSGRRKLNHNYYQKNSKNGIECYFSGLTNRYFTFTENRISKSEKITDQTEQVIYLLKKYMYKGGRNLYTAAIETIRKSKNGNKFSSLYDRGDISAYGNDDSSADMALTSILAWYFQGDYNAIDEVFRKSALYRPKWEREDYRRETIKKAIALCGGEFYRGGKGRPCTQVNTKLCSYEEASYSTKEYFTLDILQDYLNKNNISIRFNDITKYINIDGMNNENQEYIQANISAIIYSELQSKYKRCSMQIISSYLDVIASRNRYNPVLELLNKYVWDNKDHLEELYKVMNIMPEDTLSRTLIKKWLLQCISLLYNKTENPFGADGILILTGPQGIGKTSLFRKLALKPEFFKEGISINFRDKDTYIRGFSCWIAELGELESSLKADIERLKSFITQSVDEYRKPYGRGDIRAVRRTSFCGTCNSNDFLVDNTGNRRFFTIEVDKIDLNRLDEFNVIQLWKQIQSIAENNLQSFRLSKDEDSLLNLRNSKHEKHLKGEDELRDILNLTDTEEYKISTEYMTVSQFKECYLEILRSYSVQQIGAVLDRLNCKQCIRRIDGKVQRVRMLPKKEHFPNNNF